MEGDENKTVLKENAASPKNQKRKKKFSSSSKTKFISNSRKDPSSTDSSSEKEDDQNMHGSSKRKTRRKSFTSLKNNNTGIKENKSRMAISDLNSGTSNSTLLNSEIPLLIINNLNVGIRSIKNNERKQDDFTSSGQASDDAYDCPGSVRWKFIPELVKNLKQKCNEMKVFLCVKTLEELGRLAAQFILERDLKCVIYNTSRDTNPHFHNFLLDNIAEARAKIENKVRIKDDMIKIKKGILSESDVVLVPIKYNFDGILAETFSKIKNSVHFFCIISEADMCTETETLVPILHRINKFILIGSGEGKPKVLSKRARELNFNRSFFQRALKRVSSS